MDLTYAWDFTDSVLVGAMSKNIWSCFQDLMGWRLSCSLRASLWIFLTLHGYSCDIKWFPNLCLQTWTDPSTGIISNDLSLHMEILQRSSSQTCPRVPCWSCKKKYRFWVSRAEGGPETLHFQQFQEYCCPVSLTFRNSSGLTRMAVVKVGRCNRPGIDML